MSSGPAAGGDEWDLIAWCIWTLAWIMLGVCSGAVLFGVSGCAVCAPSAGADAGNILCQTPDWCEWASYGETACENAGGQVVPVCRAGAVGCCSWYDEASSTDGRTCWYVDGAQYRLSCEANGGTWTNEP